MYSGCDYLLSLKSLCTFWHCHPYFILQFYSIVFVLIIDALASTSLKSLPWVGNQRLRSSHLLFTLFTTTCFAFLDTTLPEAPGSISRPLPIIECHVGARSLHFLWLFGGQNITKIRKATLLVVATSYL